MDFSSSTYDLPLNGQIFFGVAAWNYPVMLRSNSSKFQNKQASTPGIERGLHWFANDSGAVQLQTETRPAGFSRMKAEMGSPFNSIGDAAKRYIAK